MRKLMAAAGRVMEGLDRCRRLRKRINELLIECDPASTPVPSESNERLMRFYDEITALMRRTRG